MAEVANPEIKGEEVPAPVPTELESKAATLGWKPQDQWEGSPDDWRGAKEFLDRQSLFNKIESLKSTIWELKRDYKSVHETVAKAERAKYETEIVKLKAERKQAAKEGDTEQVVEISDRLEQVQAQAAQVVVPAAAANPDPAFNEWVSTNRWYTDSVSLKRDADAFGYNYKQENPNASLQDVLNHVTVKMRKLYPDELGVKAKVTAPAVDGGGTNQRPSRSSKATEADLSDMEREVMNKFIKLKIYGNIPVAEAKAKYIKSLSDKKGAA